LYDSMVSSNQGSFVGNSRQRSGSHSSNTAIHDARFRTSAQYGHERSQNNERMNNYRPNYS
jgi:hypothetical protein